MKKPKLGSALWIVLLSFAVMGSAYADDLNIVTGNRGSCYTPAKTHFHNLGSDITPIGAAYFSYQDGYSYAVIDDGGAKGPASGRVVGALEKYASENGASEFLDCGNVPRCGGGKTQVCAIKISSAGSFLPISRGERISLSKVPSSSVEFFPENGHFRIMDSPELFDSLNRLPAQKNAAHSIGDDYKSYNVRRTSQMECSQTVRPEGNVDQQCDFNLSTIGGSTLRGAVAQLTQAAAAPNTMLLPPATVSVQGNGPIARDARIMDAASQRKSVSTATKSFCPAGYVCDEPIYSSGDPGYKAGSAK